MGNVRSSWYCENSFLYPADKGRSFLLIWSKRVYYDKTLDQMAECPMAKLFRGSNETGLSRSAIREAPWSSEQRKVNEKRKACIAAEEKRFAIDCFDSRATPDCFDSTAAIDGWRHIPRTVPTSSTINSQVAVSILSAIMSGPNPVQRTALQVSDVH